MMDRPLASANDDSDIRNAFAAARKLLDDPEHMEDAITELTALADRGCSEAMVCLGTVYLEGEDLQRKDEAAALFKKAADLGDSGGMRNLGYMHAVGIHTEKDKQKAIEWYTRSANAGNPRAQCNLGVIYNHGKYVPADHMEAVKWFSLSAMNGYSRGQTNLGMMMLEGKGVNMDPSMAAYMFSLSRSPRAYYQLAKQHLSGNGVEKNEIKALSLLEDSSSRGYSKATFVLASITEKTHPQRSAELYAAAASKGNKDAMRRLDELGLLCPETGPAHRKRHK